jgi:GH24 family phage-related lysozyme (muramidase)
MRFAPLHLVIASVFAALCASAAAQDAPAVADPASPVVAAPPAASQEAPASAPDHAAAAAIPAAVSAPASSAVQILQSFHDSDIKFNLADLMDTLRDKRHEGWVLAAYPDPKTGHPLIGAGFTLDLPERPHVQPDALNPHPFLEPSSADLWRAAGLDPARLDTILDQYQDRFTAWKKKGFRRRIPTLAAQITEDDATQLLRIAAIQSVFNAKAYCRNFDRMTGPQQMALSQLVYQIGVNLVRFDEFLSQINDGVPATAVAADAPADSLALDHEYWQSVQHTLIQTQWAHLYRTRAIAVIAMLDPSYADSPTAAEHLVGASLRPAVAHRRRGHSAGLSQVASKSTHSPRAAGKRKAHARPKRKA